MNGRGRPPRARPRSDGAKRALPALARRHHAQHPVAPRQQQQQEVDRDPLIHGWSGWRTVITGALGALSTFLSSLFELLGFEQAQKLGEVSAQILIGLAVVFLILKFWKRFETILKGRIK